VSLITFLGLTAGSLTTIAFVPQAVRAWRTRSTKDVSFAMFAIMFTGIVMWLVYGLARGDIPLIAANAVTLVLAASILVAKIRFG